MFYKRCVRQLDKIELVKAVKVQEGAGVLSLKALLQSFPAVNFFLWTTHTACSNREQHQNNLILSLRHRHRKQNICVVVVGEICHVEVTLNVLAFTVIDLKCTPLTYRYRFSPIYGQIPTVSTVSQFHLSGKGIESKNLCHRCIILCERGPESGEE